jgi:hypothetical protein
MRRDDRKGGDAVVQVAGNRARARVHGEEAVWVEGGIFERRHR